jgi:hypothetical protein
MLTTYAFHREECVHQPFFPNCTEIEPVLPIPQATADNMSICDSHLLILYKCRGVDDSLRCRETGTMSCMGDLGVPWPAMAMPCKTLGIVQLKAATVPHVAVLLMQGFLAILQQFCLKSQLLHCHR